MGEKIFCDKEFVEGSYRDVLIAVRDKIHKGHRLLSHPLSGSVKPNETPYKSVIISRNSAGMDLDSLKIIEDSIAAYDKFMQNSMKYLATSAMQLRSSITTRPPDPMIEPSAPRL